MLLRSYAVVYALGLLLSVGLARRNRERSARRHTERHRSNADLVSLLSTIKEANDSISQDLIRKNGVSGVVQVDDRTWKWKSRSGPVMLEDIIVKSVLKDLGSSISFSMDVRPNLRKRMTLLHAFSDIESVGTTTWLEVVIDSSDDTLVLYHRTSSLLLSSSAFTLPTASHRSWAKIFLSIHTETSNGTSKITSQFGCNEPQETELIEGVSLALPMDLKMAVGGNHENLDTSFTGQIRDARVHIPALNSCPWECDVETAHPARTFHTSQRKRGAPSRKHSGSKRRIATSRRDISRDHDGANEQIRMETIIEELQTEIRSCRDENRKMNIEMQTMRKIQSSLENRVFALESCECIPMCIMTDGVKRRHGEIWEVSDCKTCECTEGETICESRKYCGGVDEVTACLRARCENNALCEEVGDTYECRCRRGYYGKHCEHIDQCAYGVCKNNGRCELTPDGGYTCHCGDGFSGDNCGDSADGCFPNPCMNAGICVSGLTGFTCECSDGFYGELCEDTDACYSSPCRNGGVCSNQGNAEYTCRCRTGFTGHDCGFQDVCYSSPCLNGGRCQQNPNDEETSVCICLDGYYGLKCEYEDACYTNPCFNGGLCLRSSLNGDTTYQYTCTCQEGYYGNRCEHQSACFPNPCLHGGRCSSELVNGDNSGFTCSCTDGFYGQRCENRDACFSSPCRNGGVCQKQPLGGFSCRCRQTHYGDFCEFTNYCRANPCMNGATCINKKSKYNQPYTCQCSDTYIGPVCEYEDLCKRRPCLNRGTCHMEDGEFTCTCPDTYYGERCELVDHCRRNPCLNGGRCENEDTGNGFRCVCTDSHIGSRCQRPHPCRPNPCLNNGLCRLTGQGGYSCQCPPSHYGPSCRSINYCRNNPCRNGGACMNNLEGFTCNCPPGYNGADCNEIAPCASNPCENKGRCIEQNGSYKCICPTSYQGKNCQYQSNICVHPMDAGTCEDYQGRSEERWYFDRHTQRCEQFVYTGCGGNGNNFLTRQACKQKCLVGVCCMLRLPAVHINGHSTSPTAYMCQSLSIGQCKRMDTQHREVQVIHYKPGTDCNDYACDIPSTCSLGGKKYELNSRIDTGCQKSCICQNAGYLKCRCEAASVRREIRRLTTEERAAFQRAITTLKTRQTEDGHNEWDSMRDEYQEAIPIAQSSRYFLLWNRGFLQKMELLLQRVDCSVTLPYFDFTLDAGRFKDSVIWQPNFFGGDGQCVPDHPFRKIVDGVSEKWQPCLSRNFSYSTTIPTMIDIAAALNSRTYEQLSGKLQNLVSYVTTYIGGEMVTSTRAYDPLFYSILAYADYIFTIWQKTHPGRNEIQHVRGINYIPLGMSPQDLWNGACVEYADVTYQIPCNRSDISEELFATDGYNLQGYDRQGFDRDGFNRFGYNALGRDRYGQLDNRGLYRYDGYNAEGYNRAGFDRRGYNRFGFDKEGHNCDGFNVGGFDRSGFNRYGLDAHGYDRRGFNMYGLNRYGDLDDSDFYDIETGYNDCCFGRDGLTSAGFDRFGFNVEGYDAQSCEYFFHGPHSLYYREKLWRQISVQPISFLSTIKHTCGPLSNIPKSLLSLSWTNNPLYMKTLQYYQSGNLTGESKTENTNLEFSKRFCFNVDMFLTWCPCLEDNYPAICTTNPCLNAFCDLHRNARCVVNMCGRECTAEFYADGRRVNCDNPCSPNPCQNGGICEPSKYSSDSERFYCRCPEDYVGSLCENPAPDTCMLSLKPGNCQAQVRRWYYNFMAAACQQFIYSGCGGNSNNFPSKQACDLRCSLGACCYRLPKNSTFVVGYDRDGYDKYGFNALGYNRHGQQHSAHDSMPTGNRIHPPKGFGPDGYDIYGYDINGFDRQGYNRDGFHKETGYNRTGFNPDGEYDQLIEYGRNGYNQSGYDREGYTCSGINKEGFNRLGLYYDFEYHCESLLLSECESLKDPNQLEIPFEVISFSPGKTCDDVKCGEECGCKVKGKVYNYGQTFQNGCESCTCTLGGVVECICQILGRRREVRDLSESDRATYAAAIREVYKSGKWGDFATQHAQHMPQANGGALSLPWHRYFLRIVEQELQMKSDCSVRIPYFDWTIDAGNLSNSQIWQTSFFGGNGEGDTNCVRHHPFSFDVHWHPCIKRRFNQTISLPDAVNFHLLLHEPNYDNFRIQLEMMSALFHLWVGGHMASPFSPYDPIYLSHWAFIDHIWDEWQKRNPMGVSRFPSEHRYVPMNPFEVTPDNVLSAEQQMCLIYIPPTLGSPCNGTNSGLWSPSIYDGLGLDRHGFNERGYDVNGFNIDGLDRAGRPDPRGQYDDAGYDIQGYHRSGFDASGWDKYDYNKFDFNRDGFSIERYDASGYNRYGFDQQGRTPYGMFRNMSFASGVDQGYAASFFDRNGYNSYGYDSKGFDHSGYDVFGFDRNGFDRENCNFYSHGPYYMRYYYFAKNQLSTMGKEMLKNIKRICPPITPLPDYWVSHIWMEKMPVARNFEKSWTELHEVDTTWMPRVSSVTKELLWLPITPDQQFCFNMDWYSGCPLGSKLLECSEDLCAESTCASLPHAQCRVKNCGSCYPEFYDGETGEVHQCYGCVTKSGETHNEGSTWHEGCNTCICQAGLLACTPMPCPALACSHPAPDPDNCCDVCDSCEYEGRLYRNKQKFFPNSCESCECTDGSVMCQNIIMNCPPTNCERPYTMPGECCPTCRTDCYGHHDGETWAMDKCINCTCMANKMVCSKITCPIVQCEHPRTIAGECCPKCLGCEYHGRKYRNLQNFMKDSCSQCTCRYGDVMCTTQQCPTLSCAHKEKPAGSCCERCKQGCEYEGTFYDSHISFQPQNNPCLNCTCQDGEPRCFRMSCPLVSCARPIVHQGQCCPACTSCQLGSAEYREGQMWTSEDRCRKCVCQRGEMRCRTIMPCKDTCTHGLSRQGQCCPDCSHCSFHGKIFRHLEPFTDPHDVCKRCSCQSGNVLCSSIQCPDVQCTFTETPVGECCPQCKSCTYNGVLKEHGSYWRMPAEPCTKCSCQEGKVECTDEYCPPARCDYPRATAESCCPTCHGCSYQGNDYSDGERILSDDICSICQCMRGNVICREKTCPNVECKVPVRKSGECCASCTTCSHEGETYDDGERFIAPRRPCLDCICEGGKVDCQRLDLNCERPMCSNPGRMWSQCCPTCNSCEYEQRNYENGTKFTPNGASPCLTCTCLSGTVRCETETCSPLACPNPIQEDGECCAVCKECRSNGKIYNNGNRWQPETCTICQCVSGRVECGPVFCPAVPCSHPAKLTSDCCATCDSCLYNGRIYSDGRSFPNPTDPCYTCTCEAGTATCIRSTCPRLDCRSPVRVAGSCCMSCPTDCEFQGEFVANGDTVRHATEQCQICVCTDGRMQCSRRVCPDSVACSHPSSSDGCCRDQCTDCRYRGIFIKNGQSITSKGNPCRTCTCTNGNIVCIRQRCTRLACDNPSTVSGKCCRTCPEPPANCIHNGLPIPHGQQFTDKCKVCQCQDHGINCEPVRCPKTSCSAPVKEGCCLSCSGGCKVNGTKYRNGQEVQTAKPSRCEVCRCSSGDVVCEPIRCPAVRCSHARVDGCCPTCEGCTYNGNSYNEGQSFLDPNSSCDNCICTNGTISCARTSCNRLTCTHPLEPEGACCPTCGGNCFLEGQVYKDGSGMFTLPSDTNECQLCICDKGSIICKDKPCPVTNCRHPVISDCGCSTCGKCLYKGVERQNRETFPNPENEKCSDCYCSGGNVVCGKRRCDSPSCTHPSQNDCNCPTCEMCTYYGITYDNGEHFPDVLEDCNTCVCQDGNVRCSSHTCDVVPCSHPLLDDCGCPSCGGCLYAGVEYGNQQHFVDSTEQCSECVCQSGEVICARVVCSAPTCLNPVLTPHDCCPKCIGTCNVRGVNYEDGATITSTHDPCSICTCSSGEIRCVRQRCDVRCANPIGQSRCCPDCSACLYQGERHDEGDVFTPLDNNCKQCSCYHGNIMCSTKFCPEPDCNNPQLVEGKCCPQCLQALSNECVARGKPRTAGETWIQDDENGVCLECRCLDSGSVSCAAPSCQGHCSHPVPVLGRCCSLCGSCYYGNHTYENGKMFRPNKCMDCACRDGNVKCVKRSCPSLQCPPHRQVKRAGDCCPQCTSCVLDGNKYADGYSWSLPEEPCIECQCLNGVVTCARVQCLQPCQVMVTVPGQCCQVCAGCYFSDKIYEIGERFQPNPMDPCEICECKATDSSTPFLCCKRLQCPSLADCPRSCIQQPRPGTCCPTCTNRPECAYGQCTAILHGQRVIPTENQCFACDCKIDSTWLCGQQPCKELSCPLMKRYTPKGECCQVCDECDLDVENTVVPSGKIWRRNECEVCRCDKGSVTCVKQTCSDTSLCQAGTVPYKQTGDCCSTCVNVDAACTYEGQSVPARHKWKTDKCTSCECFAGKVKCITQKCRLLKCNADQAPTSISGECCPVCMLRPASCIAFGDPHYETFDGRTINFQGTCHYLLTADCSKSEFKVIVHNSNLGARNGRVSWTDQVTIMTEGGTISMMRDYTVRLNGTVVPRLPLSLLPYYYVEIVGNYLLLSTHLGVHISWNGQQRRLEVSVPGTYKRRTCGLCGNFNNYPQDDARLHNSRLTSSDSEFGNDWKVNLPNAAPCPDVTDINPCDGVNYMLRKLANEKCKILMSKTFSACHSLVNPETFFASCVYDTCACGQNDQSCFCDVLESYAAQCRRSGVVIHWRNPMLCAIACAYERGYVFDECGSPCKRTCANRNLPPGVIAEQCYLPCVSGCQCPAGKVEHGGRCMLAELCPDTLTSVAAETFPVSTENIKRHVSTFPPNQNSQLVEPVLTAPSQRERKQ